MSKATEFDCASCAHRSVRVTEEPCNSCGTSLSRWTPKGAAPAPVSLHAAAAVLVAESASSELRAAVAEQPAPVLNSHPAAWDLVMADFKARDAMGRRRYGVPLQPHNGRKTLHDAYQEALDLAVYLRTAIYEMEGC